MSGRERTLLDGPGSWAYRWPDRNVNPALKNDRCDRGHFGSSLTPQVGTLRP